MPPTNNKKPVRKKKSEEVVIVTDLGRQQPQAVDFEEVVIGACLIEQEAFGQIADILKPGSFYETKHRLIFEAIQSLSAENKPIDILTVTEQMRVNGTLDQAGGPYYIAELSNKVVSSAHIEYHAKIIAQKALARELITYASRLQESAFTEGQDIDELMQTAEGQLFELSKTNIKKDFVQIDPVLTEAYQLVEKAAANTDGISGISSGFHRLDDITNGWQKSDLIIIAARPAMGKTAFVLSMARNIAIDQRLPVAMFSLEMSNVQLVNRLIVNVCEISSEKIRSGRLAPYEWQQMSHGMQQMYGAPLYIDDTPSLSVFELRTKARRLVREHGVRLIMIDYLQLMNASGMSYNSRQEEVSVISRSLKALAKELDIPIIALSQLNRGVENRIAGASSEEQKDTHRPQLADLRESGAIEQDADMVCMIHRPEYYGILKDAHGRSLKGISEIIIAKHRNGKTDDVRLRFIGEYARFANMEDEISLPGEPEAGGLIQSRMNNRAPLAEDDPLNSITMQDAPF
ncbi:MAG: replicative DNA helicase [Bacteroidaceae bacterium]|jgi:replicative DNA helicase|nr:replicative DNA helicase [Bacteroidaceae bacterium]MCR4836946.1 replicative DNA helicase [Bacteroidaceae bacterium]